MREGKVSSYEVRANQFILLATNARECLKRRDVKIYTCVSSFFPWSWTVWLSPCTQRLSLTRVAILNAMLTYSVSLP